MHLIAKKVEYPGLFSKVLELIQKLSKPIRAFLYQFNFKSFSVLEVMRSPLAPDAKQALEAETHIVEILKSDAVL